MSPRRWLPLALVVVAASRCLCVLPQLGIGDECRKSTDCLSGLVCVLLDEENPAGEAVCMPPLKLDRTSCSDDDECTRAGLPVDAYCTAGGHCACDLEEMTTLSCDTNEFPGRFACGCVSADEGDVGDECGHPEECATLACSVDEGRCIEECTTDDDCGGLLPHCVGGTCSE